MKRDLLFAIILFACLFAIGQIRGQSVDSINVESYNISLDVNNLIPNAHTGYCEIEARVIEPEHKWARLSLLNQEVDSVWVDSSPVNFLYNSPALIFELPYGVVNNDIVDIKVKYTGSQVVEAYGWGGIHYDNNIIYTLNVAIMDNPHSFGRSWFPCQDMFNDKARFSYNITTRNNRQVYCGGILDSVASPSDSTSSYHYRIPQNIAPYLASMTIADFVLVGDTLIGLEKEMPLEIWCFSQDSLAVSAKVDMIKNAFHNLESKFGAFPFNKVAYCVTPNGSMEHVDNIALARSAAIGSGDGNNSNIVHELGHSWFGNYMGGETESNMWIKEGWTSMTENLSMEAAFGREYAKNYFRKEQEWILNVLPHNEGYRALYPVEGNNIYSRTTYRKGAAVVHNLKGFLGDSIFYPAVRDMLSDHGYHYINTFEMRDYLSNKTGIDLSDYWDFHVLDSGYNHYRLTQKDFSDNQAIIGVRQSFVGNNKGLNYNRVPISFFDADWNRFNTIIEFVGNATIDTISLPFTPINAFLDIEEQLADATLDLYKTVHGSGRVDFPNTGFYAEVESLEDSVFLRVTLNWVGEDRGALLPQGIERISHKHYWTIEGINLEEAKISSNFFFRTAAGSFNFDNELLRSYSGVDSLMIMYRPNSNSPWIPVRTTTPQSVTEGYLTLNSLWEGEYIMAIGDVSIVGLEDEEPLEASNEFRIIPNPSSGKINISLENNNRDYLIYIYNSSGRIVYSGSIARNTSNLKLSLDLETGVYPVVLVSKDGKYRMDNKIIIAK